MTDRDFLLLVQDALSTDTFVNKPSRVFEARTEVGKRLEAMDELQRKFMETVSEEPRDEWSAP